MSIPGILKVCAAVYLGLIFIDWIRSRSGKRFLLELLPLLALIVLDVAIASKSAGYVTFGSGASPTLVVFIMFAAILLGVAARYVFYLRGNFSWLDFVKPMCVSPILLLPLIGSLEAVKSLEPIQVFSFGLLAFQNGFFWQAVLQRTRPKK
ncbi:MAG TPA: hypothetical protein VNX66_05390 [Candidatus Sulfotelmatobacter sp.]|jgi:hypothetical protein|nr:hypothetical protein [Candidatus Sulfotelmatobacter sp.]